MTYSSKDVADTQCQGTTRVGFLGPLGKSKGRLAGSLLLSAREGEQGHCYYQQGKVSMSGEQSYCYY